MGQKISFLLRTHMVCERRSLIGGEVCPKVDIRGRRIALTVTVELGVIVSDHGDVSVQTESLSVSSVKPEETQVSLDQMVRPFTTTNLCDRTTALAQGFGGCRLIDH